MKTTIYVFTYTSTETLGIEGTESFSSIEKARAYMKEWEKATATDKGDKVCEFNEDYAQVVTASGVTWTAEITETVLDQEAHLQEYSDTIVMEDGKKYYGTFRDGHALLTEVDTENTALLTYPYLEDLTSEQVREIEEYTGRPLEEYFQIAVKYREPAKPKTTTP